MLVAQYDQSDAYLTQEAYDELDEDQKEDTEPGEYSEDIDMMYYDDYKYGVKDAFKKRKFPLLLIARKSNWQGQDGTARCSDVEDVISKVAGFDSGSIELHKGRGNSLKFKMGGTHDVPMGFMIEVQPLAYTGD